MTQLRMARTSKLKAVQNTGKKASKQFAEELEALKQKLVKPRAVRYELVVGSAVFGAASTLGVAGDVCVLPDVWKQDVKEKAAKMLGARQRHEEAVAQLTSFRQLLGPANPTTLNADQVTVGAYLLLSVERLCVVS